VLHRFFEGVTSIHLGNIILVDHNPVRIMMNLINNVMFVEKWNGRIKVSLNYLMVVVLPTLRLFIPFVYTSISFKNQMLGLNVINSITQGS
jgi:hypothetical protein